MKRYFSCIRTPKILFISILFLMLTSISFSQEDNLFQKAQELIYTNPDEAIKVANHILSLAKNPQDKVVPNLMMAQCYIVKGEYNNAAMYAFDENNFSTDIPLINQIEVNILTAELSRKLYLDDLAKKQLLKAQELTSKLQTVKIKDSLQDVLDFEHILTLTDRRESSAALIAINKIENSEYIKNNIPERIRLYIAKERAFSHITKLDSATIYIEKSLNLIELSQSNNLYIKAIIYNELGRLNLQKKDFIESEKSLFIALRFAEIIKNQSLLMEINRDLAINYLATNQKSKHKVYNDEFLLLNNDVELMEQKSVNTIYNLISKQQENILVSHQSIYSKYQNFLPIAILIVLIICAFILYKSSARKKRLNDINKYLEISRNHYIKIKPTKKTTTKRIIIPEETENTILQKLKRFEASKKYLNKDMSLAVLAGQFETNTKYLSEIINKHYNDNFNTFINKLRINYIIEKLKTDSNYINYKISVLADESGYAAHSTFATVFKSIIGMSPVTFINLIIEDRETTNLKNNLDDTK